MNKRTLKIIIDLRCCNEKNIIVDDFQNDLKNEFSNYNTTFSLDKSPIDVICTQGYLMIDVENSTDKEINDITKTIEKTFHTMERV